MPQQWYGCPKCSSSQYKRRDFDEIDAVRILFYCVCGHIFSNPLLFWIDKEPLPEYDLDYQDPREYPDWG
ncbi:hypothetical protein NIES4072_29910 [Nostoc commune NIES-4072]|uniref:Uncharacterized protein n=1 Tax=Nostoc commune NIES-4072 TaxID=2005467 RepID=A0A2R5FUH3_NOSCO|nr:hypothetical protein [Nostoc commune]BBD69674.1 hypothetical protein NIES4070_60840 [Nostoc commune HK-02]GBG19324.1 hypothetical protein NIES4072_29910 [Nostoc commune NIES-4072]